MALYEEFQRHEEPALSFAGPGWCSRKLSSNPFRILYSRPYAVPMKIPCSLGFDWSLRRRLIHKSLAWHPARQLRASLGIMLPSLNNQRLRLIRLIYNDSRPPVICSKFLSNSNSWKLKNTSYPLYIRTTEFLDALKSFLLNIAFLSLTFPHFESKVYKVFYVILYLCLEQL